MIMKVNALLLLSDTTKDHTTKSNHTMMKVKEETRRMKPMRGRDEEQLGLKRRLGCHSSNLITKLTNFYQVILHP